MNAIPDRVSFADAILSGYICQNCHNTIDGNAPGHARTCVPCLTAAGLCKRWRVRRKRPMRTGGKPGASR